MKALVSKKRIKKSCFSLMLLFLLFFITACGGIVPGPTPKVEKTSPENGELNVNLNKLITVTFSKEIAPETLTNSTLFLREKGGPLVPGDVSVNGQSATFKLQAGNTLTGNTVFEVTVTTGVKDLSGKSLPINHLWEFTSAAPGTFDSIPPTVVSTDPADGEGNVALDSLIVVTFSEAIDPATITPQTFDVSGGTKGTFLVSGNVVTLTPSRDLRENRTLDVIIKGGGSGCTSCVKDLAGNPLANDFLWAFFTEEKNDPI
ncbi:MAG: Ig-like domain-containing protein [Nitrospiria bacterium]